MLSASLAKAKGTDVRQIITARIRLRSFLVIIIFYYPFKLNFYILPRLLKVTGLRYPLEPEPTCRKVLSIVIGFISTFL